MTRNSQNCIFIQNCLLVVLLLILAGCSSRHTPAPVSDIVTKVPLSQRKNKISTARYIVKKGETLYSIAWRANTDVRTLARINHIKSPYRIYPGQKIHLSAKSSKVSHSKALAKNSNKRSGLTSSKTDKKTVDLNKKQAYGGSEAGGKVAKKSFKTKTKGKTFSTKVRDWQWPTLGKIVEGFSTASTGNKGIDIAGERGQAVKAAASGKVVYAGDALRGYGHLIIIKHNDDYLSAYAHNDRLLVKEKQRVKAGQVIAQMGSSDAQRVMLHFEVRFRGKSVNPLKYLPKK